MQYDSQDGANANRLYTKGSYETVMSVLVCKTNHK